MAWASTVAVVVPSPAMSFVFLATSRTIWAPMFSNLSASSISLATETPSLVTRGAPKLFSSRTLRPLGPRVTFTASASLLMPARIFCWAWASKMICLAAIGCSSVDHREDVVLAQTQLLRSFALDLGPAVLAEEALVALLHLERRDLAVLADAAVADGLDHTLNRLLFGRVGNDDAALGLLFFFQALDEHAIVQRTNLHLFLPLGRRPWAAPRRMRGTREFTVRPPARAAGPL